MDKDKLIAMILNNVNVGGLFAEALDQYLEPALQKVVADSANTIDDAAMAIIYPIVKDELKKALEDAINKLKPVPVA